MKQWLKQMALSLGQKITLTPVLIAAGGMLAIGIGFEQNAGLYKRGILSGTWYDATLITVLLLPPLIGQVTAWVMRYRSAFWWLLWVPAVLIYWGRPWQSDAGWALYWHEHLRAGDMLMGVFRQQATPGTFIRLTAMLTMAMVTFMVLARPWLRLSAWLREMGRDTGKSAGTASGGTTEGLPQATWASAADIRNRFTHKGGIVLGEHTDPLEGTPGFDPGRPRTWKRQGKGRLITMDPAQGNGHVIVLAASAGYKTAGVVIPNILHYTDPIVVIDPKGDLYARTRHARDAMGFNPRVIDAQHGFDPFRLIAPLAPQAPSVYLTMARTLMPQSERASDISEYFHEMSTTLFAALMAHFIARNSQNVAQDISKFINREREEVINDAREIAERYDFPFITDELEGLAALDERTFPGVVKGISNKLAYTRFPDIAAYSQSGESGDAHLSALDPKTDIYVNFPAQAAEDFSSFPRLLIGAIYVASELIEQPDRPRARRLLMIDEARVLGGMSALNTIRDAGRSIGLHLMLIYQSYGQLVKAWGSEAGAAAWMDSCEARAISAVGSSRTAKDIISMLGRRTLRTRVQGSSASNPVMVPMGGSVSTSEQEQIREVSLMSAAALGQLPAHGAIVFTRKSRPILATKAIYFTRKNMQARVKSPDAVTEELEATKRRKAILQEMSARKRRDLPDPQPGLRREHMPQESVDPETGEIRSAKAGRSDPGQDMTQGEAGPVTEDGGPPNPTSAPAPAGTEATAAITTEQPNPAGQVHEAQHEHQKDTNPLLTYPATIRARIDAAMAEKRAGAKDKEIAADAKGADPDPRADAQHEDTAEQPDEPVAKSPEGNGLNRQDRDAVETIQSLLAEHPHLADLPIREVLELIGAEALRDRDAAPIPPAGSPAPSEEDPITTEIDGALDILQDADKKAAKPKKKKADRAAGGDSGTAPAKDSQTSKSAAEEEAKPKTEPERLDPSREDPPADHLQDAASRDLSTSNDSSKEDDASPDPEVEGAVEIASELDLQGTENKATEDTQGDEDPKRKKPGKAPSKPARSKSSKTSSKSKRANDPTSKRRAALKADDIREAIDAHIEHLFVSYCGEPVRRGAQEWRAKDNPSFSMRMSGEKRGRWQDFGTGESGDIFDFIAIHFCDLPEAKADFPRVLEEAAELVGVSPSQDTPARQKARAQQKAERDRKAQEEEQRRAEERNMLISALSENAITVKGTPAETYLTGRAIPDWPASGLAFLPVLDKDLPEPLRSSLHSPNRQSLVIWAQDDARTVTGGQRILLTRAGSKVNLKTAKPCFGTVAGAPARFAARPDAEGDETSTGPRPDTLLVAEGPETALTLWHLTGYETWAVFGVTNWKTAPLPTNRAIILAPDQDDPSGPAGQAFRKAVAHHMERGCTLRIAPAPEPEASKRDLNDTLMTHGAGAVLAALDAAHPPGPQDLPDLPDPSDEEGKDERPEDEAKSGGST